jgi:Fe-S-cluster containining protein
MKISKKQESSICLSCGECCKKYWITILPEEATKISKVLKVSKKDFLINNCLLNVKLFPKSTHGVLTFPSTFFPKKIYELLEKKVDNISGSYFIVPQIVLRKEQKPVTNFSNNKVLQEERNACIFLNPNNSCEIYHARPQPCKLFPFIAVPGYRDQYPFCELFKKTFKDYSRESRTYYKKVQDYFKKVDKTSFSSIWKNPPKTGLLYLQDIFLGEISLKELEEMMHKNNLNHSSK